jgi:hypothetical protein
MAARRKIDLSTFDERLIDGLKFCGMVYDLLEQIQSEADGIGRIRLQSTRTEKRLIEELIPLARYAQARYRPGLKIKVRWFDGSQRFDARLLCSGSLVTKGLWPKEMLAEITSSVRENDHLVRKHSHESGGSFAAKGTTRNKKTGKIESKPHVYQGGERIDDFVDQTIGQLVAKNDKNYPLGTVLIVRCVPDGILLEDEWESAVRQIKDAKVDIKFREVFLTEPVMNLSATLYGAH